MPNHPEHVPWRALLDERLLSLDLTYGSWSTSTMYEYLLDNGMTRDEYHWFSATTSSALRHGQRLLLTNEHLVRTTASPSVIFGYYVITHQYFTRYSLPVMNIRRRVQNTKRCHRSGDRAGHRVGIDVVGLAAGTDADRGDDRDDVGLAKGGEHAFRNVLRLADKPEIAACFLLFFPFFFSFCCRQPPASRLTSRSLMLPARTISTTSIVSPSVTRFVDKAGLDAEPIKHAVDLRAAAMHHDRMDANLFQQRNVAREGVAAGAHCVPAVFDDDGLVGVLAQIRHRLRQDCGLESGIGRARRGCDRRLVDDVHGRHFILAAATALPQAPLRRAADQPRQSRPRRRAMRRCPAAFRRWSMHLRSCCGAPHSVRGDGLGDRVGVCGPSLSTLVSTTWTIQPGGVAQRHHRGVAGFYPAPRIDQQANSARRLARRRRYCCDSREQMTERKKKKKNRSLT